MWFQASKILQALKDSGFKPAWLPKRLGCSQSDLIKILNGEVAASYRVAKELLLLLGYDAVVQAIDWRLTRYASV